MTKLRVNNSFMRGRDDKKFRLKFCKLKYINILLFVLVIIAGVFYIIITNNLSIKGFELNELKKETKNLSSKNDGLKVQSMSLESYDNLHKKIQDLKMVAVGEVLYIAANNQAVAKK